jgi:uncharacterized iron-regulated membrane protein
LNRIVHRIVAFLAVLLMLWLAGTGATIQLLDLNAVLTHAPATDPTRVSMVEGMYGQPNFAVIQLADFSAAPLPPDFDIKQAAAIVLQSAHASTMDWLELRRVDGIPVGQVMVGTQLEAFDARNGTPVTASPPQRIPQGARLPPSLRQKLKTLHRFWNRGDTPGVYFEFLAGLVLFTLLITGLVMYFQLLRARRRIKRRQLFWLTGGTWRGWHRGVSVAAAAFLLCMAFSGTWIGFESSWNALGRSGGGGPPPAVPVAAAAIPNMTATTLQAMQRLHPGTPIKVIRLRMFGQMQQGVVITGGDTTDQLVFNAETGQPASLTEPAYPPVGFPFGVQVHENIKHFHSGEMFGLSGQMMNLLAGLSLLFLSVSGLVMYFDMWLKRCKGGRGSLLWK